MDELAVTPAPPYYAVVFTSMRAPGHVEEYEAMSAKMADLARRQPGYLGIESARGNSGLGITVSYWKDETSIAAWKSEAEHLIAQRLGKKKWYQAYRVRVCKVERSYGMDSPARDGRPAARGKA